MQLINYTIIHKITVLSVLLIMTTQNYDQSIT